MLLTIGGSLIQQFCFISIKATKILAFKDFLVVHVFWSQFRVASEISRNFRFSISRNLVEISRNRNFVKNVQFGEIEIRCCIDPPYAHCPLPTVYCPLSTAHCPMSTAHCPLLHIHCSLPAHCLLPTTLYTPYTVQCPMPTAYCPLFTVHCPQ